MYSTFVAKNIKNAMSIAFYVTLQDIAFFCAVNFYAPTTGTALGVVYLIVSVILGVGVFLMVVWMSRAINFPYRISKEDKLYNYELMFLYRMDYDLFLTYSLTNLP